MGPPSPRGGLALGFAHDESLREQGGLGITIGCCICNGVLWSSPIKIHDSLKALDIETHASLVGTIPEYRGYHCISICK